MKNVLIRYPFENTTKERKFKVASTTNGAVLRTYIGHQFPQFRSLQYFLVLNDSDGRMIFLDESKPLSQISQTKRIRLRLVLKNFNSTVKFYDGSTKNVTINLTENVKDNMKNIIEGNADEYVLFFIPKNEQNIYKIVVEDLPLIYQGWFLEDLILLKRIDTKNLENENEEFLQEDYISLKSAAIYGISLYNVTLWGTLSFLQFLADGGNLNLNGKMTFMYFVPEQIRSDAILMKSYNDAQELYKNLSQEEAKKKFVELAVYKGSTYCFVDKVKFLFITKKKKISSNRFLYISRNYISITKQYGSEILLNEKISQITDVSYDEDFVIVTFLNTDKWKLKSEYPNVLMSILKSFESLIPQAIDQDISSTKDSHSDELELTENESQSDFFIENNNVKEQFEQLQQTKDIQCMSPLICPSSEESNVIFSVENQMYKDLKINDNLVIPESILTHKDYQIDKIDDSSIAYHIGILFNDQSKLKLMAVIFFSLAVLLFLRIR